MRKILLAINTTPDGFCDHRSVIADNELHAFYSQLLRNAGTVLYGRKTFQLMDHYWPMIAKSRKGTAQEIEFAELLDEMEKIVFSKSGFRSDWKKTIVLEKLSESVILELKQKPGKDILVGSPSIVDQLIKMNLIDEFIYAVQPILAGSGKRFFEFEKLEGKIRLSFQGSESFSSGVQVLRYHMAKT